MAHILVAIGVDGGRIGRRAGWVFVRLENGKFRSAEFREQIAAGIGASSDAAVVAVDMQIGYPRPTALERAADGLARNMVGPRGNAVFQALHPDVLAATDKAAAHGAWFRLTGHRVPPPALALAPRIREVAAIAATDPRVYEVHPEVSFAALAGRHLESKKNWNGQADRRRLLEEAGIVIPDDLGRAGAVSADDILDAAVAAWSANRIAEEIAASLPDPPELDATGRGTAIWY